MTHDRHPGRGIREGVRRFFRLPLRSAAVARADADEELDAYIAARIEHLVARGMTRDDARAEAQRRLGGTVIEVRALLRSSAERREGRLQMRERFADVVQDVRYAARGLARRPVFSVSAILCLAIGIGANATMFGVVDALLLRPPSAVRDPGSVVRIDVRRTEPDSGIGAPLGLSYPDYVDLQRVPALAGVAAYSGGDRTLGRGATARRVNTLFVTHTFMPVLGVTPALGRFFSADEDADNGSRVVVLGHAFWQTQFAGATDVLGKTVLIDDKQLSVIGVAPRDFNGVERSTVDVYLPPGALADLNRLRSRPFPLADRGFDFFSIVGRITPGVRRDQLARDLDALYHRSDAVDHDRIKKAIVVMSPTSLAAMPSERQVQNVIVSLWLYGGAGIVLLIACANVASLLLARGIARRREIAVRLALGIGRARLVRLLMTESVLLAILGCAGGLVIARWGGGVIRSALLSDMNAGTARLDARVFVVTLLTTVFTSLACGLVPSLLATRPNLTTTLKFAEHVGTDGRGRVGSGLLVGQIALTLALLVGGGLFVQSLRNLDAIDFGFDARHVLFANIGDDAYTAAQADQRFQDVLERTRAIPGVEHASLATSGPFGIMWFKPLDVPGREGEALPPRLSAVTPDFFGTMGIVLRRGRLFTAGDDASGARVAVVNEEMAAHFWPQGDALGKCFHIGGTTARCTMVVGIVRNARQGDWPGQPIQSETPMSAYYIPFAQRDSNTSDRRRALLYVRSTGNAADLVAAVGRARKAVFPDLSPEDPIALSTSLARQFRSWRLGATMFAIFGGIALGLAIVGLYGVLAFRVSQRTHEIGVRMALGARREDVRRLVVEQGLRLGAIGVVIGLGATLAMARLLDGLLFGVSSHDPRILAAVAATLLVVAGLASYVPALRASRTDPMEALREL